jgi:hypothetical protein
MRELEKVLAREDELLPPTGRVEYTIELTDERPVWVLHRMYPYAQLDVLKKELKKLLDRGDDPTIKISVQRPVVGFSEEPRPGRTAVLSTIY